MTKRVLISTGIPSSGGVRQMTRFVAQCMVEAGYLTALAYHEPYSISPTLSVPAIRLFQRRIGIRQTKAFDGLEAYAIGAWLPELEFTHYWPSRLWKELIEPSDYCISVSGNCLAGTPFALARKPFLSWVATPWHQDRKDRVRHFPWYRKLLDNTVNGNVLRALEKRVLRHGTILALSQYTREKLNALVQENIAQDVMPMPIDIERFHPDASGVVAGRVGFVGRLDDPRKNLALLLKSLALCVDQGHPITAELIGGNPDVESKEMVNSLNLTDKVNFIPYLERDKLPDHLRSFDLFVIPSHQEGLCIAALEAMACGCPVVSTRCGGPEEFVVDGETGFLVDHDPESMANAIVRILTDRPLRSRLSENARMLVEQRYNPLLAKEKFWKAFDKTFYVH